jgi:hypothetical protein
MNRMVAYQSALIEHIYDPYPSVEYDRLHSILSTKGGWSTHQVNNHPPRASTPVQVPTTAQYISHLSINTSPAGSEDGVERAL